MSKWFYINPMILLFVLWKVSNGPLLLHSLFGGLGMIFILYNWTRQAFFATIRSDINRERKIKFATISKKAQPFHKWTGSVALLLVLFHVTYISNYFPIQITNLKIVSGLFAIFALMGVVFFGWLRHYRTTLVRRYIHWTFAYLVVIFAVIHIML